MRRAVLILSVLLVSASALPVQAQRASAVVRNGKSRDEVKSRMEDHPLKGEYTTDEKSKLCLDLGKTMNWCYYFVEGACRAQRMMTKGKTKKDAMKSLVELKRKWGQPVAYAADATEVSTFKQAVSLAENRVIVAFPPNDKGIARIWEMLTTPTGKAGMTDGKYTYMETDIDTSYLSSLPFTDYWQ